MYLSIGSALNDQIFKHQVQSHIKQHLDLFTDNVKYAQFFLHDL